MDPTKIENHAMNEPKDSCDGGVVGGSGGNENSTQNIANKKCPDWQTDKSGHIGGEKVDTFWGLQAKAKHI